MKLIVSAIVLVVLMVAGVAVVGTHRSMADTGAAGEAIHLPERTATPVPQSGEPRPAPAAADALAPLTITLATVWEGPRGQRHETTQVVMRTTDRVRLVLDGVRKEWLFQRNAVEPARVSGYLVDHTSRQILVHDESELRTGQGLRGWADVLMMRFDPQILSTLQATGKRNRVDGDTFTQYIAADRQRRGVVEVWWSDALLLAQRLVVREADYVTTSTITRIDRAIERSTLADPRGRFPDYEIIDPGDAGDHRH
jgi:hypothetical protein